MNVNRLIILTSILCTPSYTNISCDFNSGLLCNDWIVLQDSERYVANWTIWSGETPTVGTGPTDDRKGKGFHYIYMESTSHRHRDMALLLSPSMAATNPVVNISFWYCLHGVFVQTLKLYLVSSNEMFPDFQDDKHELLTTIQGEQGPEWKHKNVYLQHDGLFKVGFQATVGSSASDVAIDDIIISGADEATYTRTKVINAIIPTKVTSTDKASKIEYITDDTVSEIYIIICSVGGGLWAIVLLLLCYCVFRGSRLHYGKRSTACNTSFSIDTYDEIDDFETKNSLNNTNGYINSSEVILDVHSLASVGSDKYITKL